MTYVIDTNVALVVRFGEQHPPELVDACEERLERILEERLPVVTDSDGEIVSEYLNKLNRSGQPSLGDRFAAYVHDYRFAWDASMRPEIAPHPTEPNTYGALGGDDAEIDPSDRKFVAAAKVAGVPVVEATDTKWLNWGPVLRRHSVEVVFAHEASIREAYRVKFGHEAP